MNFMEQFSARMLQDCWSLLYKNLACCVLDRWGKMGESAVRKAVHLCGERMGTLEREKQTAQGRRSNLAACFSQPQMVLPDPRFQIKWQLFNEQEAVFDVLSCPIRDLLTERGGSGALLLFCEEHLHGCIMGYTETVGQCCLAEDFAFPGECSCRFSCYFRPANLPPDSRELRFSSGPLAEEAAPGTYAVDPNAEVRITRWASILVDSFLRESVKIHDSGAVCAVASGLKAAAGETISYCRSLCAAVHRNLDDDFVKRNCLWGQPPHADEELAPEAASLIEINYCRLLREAAGQR